MPEGPEVHGCAEILHQAYAGSYLIGMYMTPNSRYWRANSIPGAELLTYRNKIISVQAHGKKIIFSMVNCTGQTIFMVSALSMEGRWLWTCEAKTALILEFGQAKLRMINSPQGRTAQMFQLIESTLYYQDSRHFGTLEVLSSEASLSQRLKSVGPDLLSGTVTLDQWSAKIRNSRISGWEICKFLMSQDRFSGIGNYLKAEILYACKLAPYRTLASLTEFDIQNLYRVACSKIQESYRSGGLTIATYKDPYGRIGTFTVHVYKQSHDPNGFAVQRSTFTDKRTTHWVPEVQI